MPKTLLLPLLADGEYRSGQELATALGVSRTAVWKQLRRLEELGIAVESVKGRGYRIPGGVDLLDGQRIRAGLRDEAANLMATLDIATSTGSTNADAMAAAQAGAARGRVFTAEQQSAGRGRRGRQWVSPFGRNIYLSITWEYEQGAAALEGLSLAVGVAIARALADCALPTVQLKWPNDILFEGAKLGGVLLEMSGDAAGPCQVVVGIGLNVNMPDEAAGAINQSWTDIQRMAAGQAPGRNDLLAALLNHLLPLLADFGSTGFAPWQSSWEALDAFAGQPVVLSAGEREMAGIARGVDGRGALQLETATTGIQSVFGGEISLRRAT